MKTVLFLCTGNYYRSRFAEALFNTIALRHALNWQAESRGLALSAANPGPISRFTRERLTALGIDVAADVRFPRTVELGDFERSSLVVAVKEIEHRPMLQQLFPDWTDRVEFWDVHDLDFATPEVALPQLEQKVEQLVTRLREQD